MTLAARTRSPLALTALALVSLASSAALAQPHHASRHHRTRLVAQAHPNTTHTTTTTTPATTTTTTTPPDAGSTTAPPDPAALNVANQIQAFYNRTTDFQADFAQVSHNRVYGQDERRSGHVRFRKPGRMRWDYAPGADSGAQGDVIQSDGTTLTVYQADQHQAIRQALSQSENQLPSALTFLSGTGNLTTDFTFRLLDAARFNYPSGYVLELTPHTPNPTYDRILFYVDAHSYQVARVVLVDAQGNTNRFDFTNPQVNMNIPETEFQWTVPAGTQIVTP